MNNSRNAILIFCCVATTVLSTECFIGSFSGLDSEYLGNLRGGTCYENLTAVDYSCPLAVNGSTCGDVACLKVITETGATNYRCNVFFTQTQEYIGWKSRCLTPESAKSQCGTITYDCNKRQVCNFGLNLCAEIPDPPGPNKWVCVGNGPATTINPVVHHQAIGSNCP